MDRQTTGIYTISVAGGESVRAFVPQPLPPNPAVDLSGQRQPLLERATLAVGRLDSLLCLAQLSVHGLQVNLRLTHGRADVPGNPGAVLRERQLGGGFAANPSRGIDEAASPGDRTEGRWKMAQCVSINDHEVVNLGSLMNKVFGEKAFVAP